MGFPGGTVGKIPPASARDTGDAGWIPGPGRSSRVGNGNPLQYSCLENSTDGGAWQATVYRVAKSQAQMKRLSMHTQMSIFSKFQFIYVQNGDYVICLM